MSKYGHKEGGELELGWIPGHKGIGKETANKVAHQFNVMLTVSIGRSSPPPEKIWFEATQDKNGRCDGRREGKKKPCEY